MNINNLTGHVPAAVLQQLPRVIADFEINTPLRLAHFLSQCAHESAGFKLTVENLNYSKESLQRVFKKYFATPEAAAAYARKPEKIGSRVYGMRMGNGPESSGEGYKYRGRGYIQLTGKNNYKAFGDRIGVDLVTSPELVATQYALLSAAWFWGTRNINQIADRGSDVATITQVTKVVNGGTNGLEDRIKHFNKLYPLL